MAEFKIRKCRAIVSELTVPGDKSISHRAAIIAALSNGTCLIDGFLPSEDCLATVDALRSLGVQIDVVRELEGLGPVTLKVHGNKGKFTAPEGPVDCGNSGTSMRLLAGLLSAQPFKSRLTGDESLSNRPMKRIIEPLLKMGAKVKAEGEDGRPPLLISPSRNREPIQYVLPVASAQVKSCILFAGLLTPGKTTVTEPITTRDHTERILDYFLVRTINDEGDISIWGNQVPESRDFAVPGDISSAAFWIVAAAANPLSMITVKNVGLNKTRTGILRVLLRMGAQISEYVEEPERGEPFGSLEVKGDRLKGTEIGGDEIPNVIDELPILAVAGALAEGTTVIRDAAELRVKETDRIAAVVQNLREMGADVQETKDGMVINGGEKLRGARLKSYGDHRMAMAFAIAGLFADGETVVEDFECVNTSYPGFGDDLNQLLGRKSSSHASLTPVISSFSRSESEEPRPEENEDEEAD